METSPLSAVHALLQFCPREHHAVRVGVFDLHPVSLADGTRALVWQLWRDLLAAMGRELVDE